MNILYHNAANPEDPDGYTWANTLVAHTELLVPVDAGDGTTTTLDESDIAYHTERVTTEFKKIIKEGLERKLYLPRDGEGSSSRIETPFSKLPEVLGFKKVENRREVHYLHVLRSSKHFLFTSNVEVLFQIPTDTITTRLTLKVCYSLFIGCRKYPMC